MKIISCGKLRNNIPPVAHGDIYMLAYLNTLQWGISNVHPPIILLFTFLT